MQVFGCGWKPGYIIHSFMGLAVTAATCIWSFKALKNINFTIKDCSPHTVFGLLTLSVVLIVTFSGMGAVMVGQFYTSKRW